MLGASIDDRNVRSLNPPKLQGLNFRDSGRRVSCHTAEIKRSDWGNMGIDYMFVGYYKRSWLRLRKDTKY